MAQDIRFSWQINPGAEVCDDDRFKRVIKSVSWALVARRWIDDKPMENFDSLSGNTDLAPPGDDFKEFDAVTPNDIVAWIEKIVGENLDAWKKVLIERIEAVPVKTTRKEQMFEKLTEKDE